MISLKNSIYNVFSKERSEESYAFNFYSMEEQYITENDFINEEERREQINEIKKILHVLTPRQREIIYYRFIEEMDPGIKNGNIQKHFLFSNCTE